MTERSVKFCIFKGRPSVISFFQRLNFNPGSFGQVNIKEQDSVTVMMQGPTSPPDAESLLCFSRPGGEDGREREGRREGGRRGDGRSQRRRRGTGTDRSGPRQQVCFQQSGGSALFSTLAARGVRERGRKFGETGERQRP